VFRAARRRGAALRGAARCGVLQAEMDECRAVNARLAERAATLERQLATMTRMYEAEVRARRTDPATTGAHCTPTSSATDNAPAAAVAALSPLHSPSVATTEIVLKNKQIKKQRQNISPPSALQPGGLNINWYRYFWLTEYSFW